MEGASSPIGGLHDWHLASETRWLSWALKICSTSPSVRGDAHWARPRPPRWRWLEARRKTANSLATPMERMNLSEGSDLSVTVLSAVRGTRPTQRHSDGGQSVGFIVQYKRIEFSPG